MAKRDFYEILGVSKTAPLDEIKKNYRKLAMQYHPDRNPGNKEAEDKFKELTEAYSILADSQKRAQYDQFGHAGVSGQGFTGGEGFSGFGDIFDDIFEGFFGGGGGGRRRRGPVHQPGADLRYDMTLSFEEAAFGTGKEVTLQINDKCKKCDGAGGEGVKTCQQCQGTGQIRVSQGFFSMARTCSECGGEGSVVSNPCRQCHGSGLERIKKKINVKIPAGIDEGSKLRLSGEGEAGRHGGGRGDLYVVIHVEPHEIFTRNEDDIFCEVPISFVDAALGAEIEAPTLTGKVNLKIPAGTQSGKVFRLRGKGIANVHGYGIGDQHIKVIVEVPTHLTSRQKQILKEFADLSNEETHPRSQEFISRLRKAFKS